MNNQDFPSIPDVNKPLDLNQSAGIPSTATQESELTNFEQPKSSGSVGVPSIPAPVPIDNTTKTAQQDNDTSQQDDNRDDTSTDQLEAKDSDGIEKVWIDKAKKLVEHTKDDPYMQERAVSRLQADYIKKRFNKDVKLPKESA